MLAKSVKSYMSKSNMYTYALHSHMTAIDYFFHKKYKCGVTCGNTCYVCDACEIDLLIKYFLS